MTQAVALLAAAWLSKRKAMLHGGLPYFVSSAIGVLLATALLHILPEAIAALGNRRLMWLVLSVSIFSLFCFERIFSAVSGPGVEPAGQPLSSHHHQASPHPLGLVVGGMLHSFVDGVSVAAAFGAGDRVGWLTALAITLHEVPHRVGEYALLMHLQVGRRRAMQLLLLVSAAALTGVGIVLLVGHTLAAASWLLPVSAGSFLYIALANLMPELAGQRAVRSTLLQLLCMLLGAAVVLVLLRLPGS